MEEQARTLNAQDCGVWVGTIKVTFYKTPQVRQVLEASHLLVNTGFCVCNLVEAGDLESICVASLSFIHVISKSQNHL